LRIGRCSLVTVFALVVYGALLLWPAFSPGLVTLGSDLTHKTGISADGCGQLTGCTLSQSALPGRLTASPVNGTVVRWRVQSVGDSERLRILDPLGVPSLFRSSSATEPTPGGAAVTSTFSTSLPISIGDRIGVDSNETSGYLVFYYPVPGASFDTFQPQPASGATASPAARPDYNGELMLNADIKPTTYFVIGRRFPLPDGVLKVRVNVSNPGFIVAGGKGKANRLVKRVRKKVSAPGGVTLKLKPSKSARLQLQGTGSATGRVTLRFRPTGGGTSSQRFTAKLEL
jgi:hypothetical protein